MTLPIGKGGDKMFWRRKKIGEVHKTYFAWDELFGVIILIVIGIVVLANL